MAHCCIFYLKNTAEKEDTFWNISEEDAYDNIKHFADYVTECDDPSDYGQRLLSSLTQLFGSENVIRDGLCYRISKNGALHYFTNMRNRLYNAVCIAKEGPIEDFVKYDPIKPGWWQIKELIDTNFADHFWICGFGCESPTNFAESILFLCRNADDVTLELRQVFDFHM